MSELLKNQVDHKFVKTLADAIVLHSKSFKKSQFVAGLTGHPDWEDKELKLRVRAIADSLGKSLDGDFRRQIEILKKVAPQTKGLGAWIFPDFIEVHGINHWEHAIPALKHFTRFFSSEFAVRPFFTQDQTRMIATMLEWSKDEDHHVRRLASEGCRPRLPWSFKLRSLIADPSPILPILENLKADESLYVRRSVANNLNDISKDHPELVLKIAKNWIGQDKNVDWVVRHGLRTLLKKGNPTALALLDLKKPKDVEINHLSLTKKSFAIGSRLEFVFEVHNARRLQQRVRIDYIIHYLKKNGSHSKKVFKLSEQDLAPKSRKKISRTHSLRQMTTRTHYPGEHHLEIAINGISLARRSFLVK